MGLRYIVLLLFSVGLKTQPESKCPELLANYCDMLLRKTPLSKKLTSEEIEAKLKEVVCFCFLLIHYSGELICLFCFLMWVEALIFRNSYAVCNNRERSLYH